MNLNVNGEQLELDNRYQNEPLLWALRDGMGLIATKFGCGIGQCGACTVHIDGVPARACQTIVNMVEGAEIRTLEGLPSNEGDLHPVQRAFLEAQAPQCGWCMSGQMMSAAALIESNPNPSTQEIYAAMQGNICRCGSYVRIEAAIKRAAEIKRGGA
ncbi:MAG: (2Fe-2S)-binding protein [Chloroflexota bacterium]